MLLLCIGQSIKLTWLASISTPSPPSPHYSLGPGSAVREKGTRSNRKNIGEPSEPSHKLGRERAAATLSPPQLMAQFSLSSTLSSLRSPTFFFRLRRFFSSFSPNAEPGPRLVPLRPLQLALKGRKGMATPLIPIVDRKWSREQNQKGSESSYWIIVSRLLSQQKVINCLFTQCFFRLSLDWGISYPFSSLGIVDFLKLIWRMSENFKSGDKMKTKRDGEQWNNKIECSFREKFA